jgi:hypothetical protein
VVTGVEAIQLASVAIAFNESFTDPRLCAAIADRITVLRQFDQGGRILVARYPPAGTRCCA